MKSGTHIPYLATDSIWTAGTVAADTVPEGERLTGVVLVPREEGVKAKPFVDRHTGTSWLLVGLLAVVCIVFARYNNNAKYIKTMFRDLSNVRERGNVFDDTAKETSFMFMLNVLCAVVTGLLLYIEIRCSGGVAVADAPVAALRCMLCTGSYCAAMPLLYWVVGHIFSDTAHTRLWVRGFLSSQAILGVVLVAPALMALFYSEAATMLCIISLCVLLILKLIFITKTFRIFFVQISSWVHFLYYLCTLEILPLVLTYTTALRYAG